ncbi:signal peptidase I [Candidatus Phytoplasma sacchari]|nr:signal peptidase I [Candidatus Phytoplasma sacchari]KAB8122850.1 signal peptidase I [Candidatus Phytoplasma sacchari]
MNKHKKVFFLYSIWMIFVYFVILLWILFFIQTFLQGKKKYFFNFSPFNYKFLQLTGESMIPSFTAGDMLLIKKISKKEFLELKASRYNGDVVAFEVMTKNNEKMRVLHRVIDKNLYNKYIITKGDNNSENDGIEIHYKMIIGKSILRMNIFVFIFFNLFLYFFLFNQKEKLIKLKEQITFSYFKTLYYKNLIILHNILKLIVFNIGIHFTLMGVYNLS